MEEFPVAPYTVQLYYAPQKDTIAASYVPAPTQVASGVLISHSTSFYLLTAKHVFDNIRTEDIVILTTMGFAARILNENVTFIDNETNNIDLALIKLTTLQVNELKSRYSFLPGQHLGFNHTFDEELFYMSYGFINKRTTLKFTDFSVESFGHLSNFRQYKKIDKLGFSYTNNITLEYNRRKQSGLLDDNRQFGFRDLKGLSGGGIWLAVQSDEPNTFDYILVGILIEERIDRGFIIGTKIDLIAESLKDTA